MTPEEAVTQIADLIFEWSGQAGRPLVLSIEDRVELAGILETVNRPQHDAHVCFICMEKEQA